MFNFAQVERPLRRHGYESIFFIRFNSVSENLDSTQLMTHHGFTRIDSTQLTTQKIFQSFDLNRLMTQTNYQEY